MTVEIRLPPGLIALVDDEDADLAALCWAARKKKKHQQTWYVARTLNRRSQYLHREILARVLGRPLEKWEQADHINNNGLDNRRANLRTATQKQNSANQRRTKRNKSGFKGVTLCKRLGKWLAMVRIDGRNKNLGRFSNIIDAAITYDRAAYAVFGEFANVNYPRFACGL